MRGLGSALSASSANHWNVPLPRSGRHSAVKSQPKALNLWRDIPDCPGARLAVAASRFAERADPADSRQFSSRPTRATSRDWRRRARAPGKGEVRIPYPPSTPYRLLAVSRAWACHCSRETGRSAAIRLWYFYARDLLPVRRSQGRWSGLCRGSRPRALRPRQDALEPQWPPPDTLKTTHETLAFRLRWVSAQ